MKRLVFTSVLIVTLLGAGLAQGELFQRGQLRVDFNSQFAPKSLPRDRSAPVSFAIGGAVRSVDGSRPPELRRISIAVNRYARIFTRGLPICQPGLLQTTSTQEALSRCRGALVGHGKFGAIVDFTKGEEFPVEGRVLAFNGGSSRKPALLIHIYGSNPVNATIVLKFAITHPPKGEFGTVFTARIPSIASDLGYVTDISLRIDRRFRYAGKPRSFFSAQCAAPAGFSVAPFALTRGTFAFANGQQISTTLTRVCKVR